MAFQILKAILFSLTVTFVASTDTNYGDDTLTGIYDDMMRRTPKFLFTLSETARQHLYGQRITMPEQVEYDFVVIGSGSAGSVIANRLSEVADWNILLLEVGEEASIVTDIPVLAPVFQFTNYNWGYLMEKQENMCLGMIDQKMAWPRGRALGGTTVMNYMIHVRGNKVDYDEWAQMGNPGWSWEDVLPYFKKSENYLVRIQDPGYHSTGGYLGVEDVPFRTASADAFVQGAQQIGYKYVDYNGEGQLGVSYAHATLRDGKRCSAEKAFLRPAKNRKNLKILTQARVTKILINPLTKQAYGVEYLKNRKYHHAIVSKEVIVSAGALGSPQLLMLSGIGPEDHLRELGIPLLQNLPVGQKLYDHLAFLGLTFTVNETIVSEQRELENPKNFLRFIAERNGPLTTLAGVEALAYIRTNVSTHPSPRYPDVELIFVSGHFSTDKGNLYKKTFRITDELYEAVWKPLEDSNVFTMFPLLMHPKSVGYMRLKSKNPFHWPQFFGNFLTHPEDIQTFIAAIRIARNIALSPAFQRYNVKEIKTPIPGCRDSLWGSDAYWECALRYVSSTLHHQVATCKMGPSHDVEAVVNHKLQVHGIRNLRVADTSVIPLPLTAHTNVPAYMVGEKAADLLKDEWMTARKH